MNQDDIFKRIHADMIAAELWMCIRCGAMVCDQDTHRLIHDDLDNQANVIAYLTTRATPTPLRPVDWKAYR